MSKYEKMFTRLVKQACTELKKNITDYSTEFYKKNKKKIKKDLTNNSEFSMLMVRKLMKELNIPDIW